MKKFKSEPLAELIKCLSSSEKRYFRKTIARESNYLKLFNGIDALKESYSEEALKDILKNENFVKHLFVTKYQLYEVVLDNLFDFYEHSTIENKIKKILNHIEMLAKKGLYQQAEMLSEKALIEIEKYELFNLMPLILDWQKYFTTYLDFDERDKINSKIYKIETDCFEKIKCNADYYRLFSEIYGFTTRNRNIRSENNENYLSSFMSNKLVIDYSNALTFKAKIYFYRIHLLYERLQRNFDAAFVLTKSILGLYELKPHMIQKNKKNFLDENLRYLIYCMNSKRFEEFYKHLPVFRDIPNKYNYKIGAAEINIIFESYVLEMACNYTQGNYDKCIKAVPYVEDYINKNKMKIRYMLHSNFYRYTAFSYFHLGDYNGCILWCSKFLNDKTRDAQFDLRVRVLLMSIISNFELEYFDNMDTLILSAFRYLNKIAEPMKYEKEILIFFRKLCRIKTDEQIVKELIILNSKLQELKKEPLIASALEGYEPAIWLEKKISLINSRNSQEMIP